MEDRALDGSAPREKRTGVAGRLDLPAEEGGGGPEGRRQGGNLIPLAMTRLASQLGSTVARRAADDFVQ